ncbi:type II toxin-antitoxin system HicB family antitoxin [Methanocalculus chunghsingensis]
MEEKMKFQVVVREDPEDGGYNVSCPAIPGCHSQGETVEEALENIKDAIVGCVEVHNEDLLRTKSTRIMEVTL